MQRKGRAAECPAFPADGVGAGREAAHPDGLPPRAAGRAARTQVLQNENKKRVKKPDSEPHCATALSVTPMKGNLTGSF